MDKDQDNQTNQTNKNKGDDLPGTAKDPTGRVISDKSSQGKDRQDQGSERSGSSYRSRDSGAQKGA